MQKRQSLQIFSWLLLSTGLALLLGGVLVLAQSDTNRSSIAKVLVLKVSGPIGPATSEYILKGIKKAEEDKAELLILQLDTPGGLDTSMRSINKAILASQVPVATYVSPSGARAASAGTYMMYASHLAVMAPGTNLGAATPVQMGGMPGGEDQKPKAGDQKDKTGRDSNTKEKASDTESKKTVGDDKKTNAKKDSEVPKADSTAMERKMQNDAAAYIRGLAGLHNRNVKWAEEAVRLASSLSAEEALKENVIDYIASDFNDLLKQAHQREVRMESSQKTLNTENAQIEVMEPDWRTKLLSVLTDPNVAYFLMLLGFYGLIYEFMNPGFVLPGVIGAICLVMALYAFQVLPINYAGVALILLGIVFMAMEAFMPSFGVMGIGGIIAFTVGSVILLDEEGYAISIPLIVGNAVVSAAFFIWVLGMLLKIRHKPSVSGVEEMLGMTGIAADSFDQSGYVRIGGELWKAISESKITQGQALRVKKIEGLLLHVEPIN